jgi:hypothetical protein
VIYSLLTRLFEIEAMDDTEEYKRDALDDLSDCSICLQVCNLRHCDEWLSLPLINGSEFSSSVLGLQDF